MHELDSVKMSLYFCVCVLYTTLVGGQNMVTAMCIAFNIGLRCCARVV